MKILRRVKLNDGRLLEYREAPTYFVFRHVRKWLWLPPFIVRHMQRRSLQRRLDGGAWTFFVGGGQ